MLFLFFDSIMSQMEAPMGWGSTDHLPSTSPPASRKAGFDGPLVQETARPHIVFIASNYSVRSYFHDVANALPFKDTRIVFSDGGENNIEDRYSLYEKCRGARVVVIGTCKKNTPLTGSYAQRLEVFAFKAARDAGAKVVLFSESLHEPVQKHLEPVRNAAQLIVVEENPLAGDNHGGFLDHFPPKTQVERGGRTDEDLERIGQLLGPLTT